jgi:ribonuclease I
MKKVLAALALLAATLTPAHAGGLHATVEGPAKDGVTYTVRALSWSPGITLKP